MIRNFVLIRTEDVSGVSGTGIVAEGTCFGDGTTIVRWLGDKRSTVVWSSIDNALAIHGHDGRTTLHWVEDQDIDVIKEYDRIAQVANDALTRCALDNEQLKKELLFARASGR